jgi:hypothetical protein
MAISNQIGPYLVLANDYVAESSAFLEQEDSIRSTSLSLTRAGAATTVEPIPLTIIGLASSDLDDLAVGLGANSLRDTASVSIACKDSRKHGRSGSENAREPHDIRWYWIQKIVTGRRS